MNFWTEDKVIIGTNLMSWGTVKENKEFVRYLPIKEPDRMVLGDFLSFGDFLSSLIGNDDIAEDE